MPRSARRHAPAAAAEQSTATPRCPTLDDSGELGVARAPNAARVGPTLKTVTAAHSQHQVTLPGGAVVDRLPLGFAAGRWWATFVSAVPGWEGREPAFDWRSARDAAWAYDPDDRLQCVGGSGGGTEREVDQTWELVDHGASRAQVTYRDAGVEVATETLTLDSTDRTGCFSTRLADGSLIERLPVGHAHGFWRLRWVRSDVPRVEVDAEMEDNDDFNMPTERFIQLRSREGPLGRLAGSGAIGGEIQPFGIDVPLTFEYLEADYLLDGERVGTEVLPLPETA